jgi:hypothetical protein
MSKLDDMGIDVPATTFLDRTKPMPQAS